MSNRKLCTGSAGLACLTLFGTVTAAPALKVLYHERLAITPWVDATGQQHVSFEAYGRRFDVDLAPNDNIARTIPSNRSDIKPYAGVVAGQSGSWVRLTQTRDGWRGVINDGQDLYAIEPGNELRSSAVQPLPDGGSSSTPVIYRLADAILSGATYCGTDISEKPASPSAKDAPIPLQSFAQLTKELSRKDIASIPGRQLVVGVVADHTFTDGVGPDPEGAIVARMDIVDGIWSSQVGIRIVLAPVTIFTDSNDRFSSTAVATDLLAEVAGFRGKLSAHSDVGLTHLMTGRAMNGNIVGIAYLGAVCDGAESVSLSQSTFSTTVGALIAAHELGHNFNAIHDGVPGVCSTTPQTYLMAPIINFSQQFSTCSLTQIGLRAETASCVKQTAPTAGGSPPTATVPPGGLTPGSVSDGSPPGGSANGGTGGGDSPGNGARGGSGSLDTGWLVFLVGLLALQPVLRKHEQQVLRVHLRARLRQ
jgi:Metallo-peptidase family M12